MRSTIIALLFVAILAAVLPAQTVVKGKITGVGGKVPVKADVLLREPFDTTIVSMVSADRTGRFRLTIPSTGVWILVFKGVHHADEEVAVYVEGKEPFDIRVRLRTYSYLSDFNKVEAFGSFNGWYPYTAVRLDKEPDGEYTARVKTTDRSISYRLLGVRDEGSTEGTQSGRYSFDRLRGYTTVIAAKDGEAKIVFDPRKLIRSEKAAEVTFANGPSIAARFNQIFYERLQFEDAFRAAFRAQMGSRGRNPEAVEFDFAGPISSVTKQLDSERDSILRRELYLNYLTLYMIGRRIAPSFYTTVLRDIPPASPVWGLGPNSLYYALGHSDLSETQQKEYINRVIAENRIRRVKSLLLFDEFMESKLKEDKARAGYYYDLLVNEFGDTPEGRRAAKLFTNPDPLSKGNRVPSFSLISSDNMVQTITEKSLMGKYSLIIFWAAEDSHSVELIADLEKAYRMYRDRKFTILTISVDSSYSDVIKFRKKEWPMPWLNAFVGKDVNDKTVKAFMAYEIPKAFLVDPNGLILETGKSLLGKELEKTLARYIKK